MINTETALFAALSRRKTNDIIYIVYSAIVESLLLAGSSKKIPLTPVPVTLQTMVLLVMSMFLGWRAAGSASALYLLEGAVGLPVFANGSGLIYLFGPTGGYLFGFFVSSLVVGYLSELNWGKSIILTFTSLTIGTIIIYCFGIFWLSYWKDMTTAITFGLLPFLTPDLLKICLGSCLVAAGSEIKSKLL
jgi:biotin transport system substrate-specific component